MYQIKVYQVKIPKPKTVKVCFILRNGYSVHYFIVCLSPNIEEVIIDYNLEFYLNIKNAFTSE